MGEAASYRSVIILGAAKSGTTALFYAVRSAVIERLGQPVEGLFEPRDPKRLREYLDGSADPVRVTKVLLGPILRSAPKLIDRFDRKVLIHRDPRDNIVSRLLFAPPKVLHSTSRGSREAIVDLIRRKEADPASVSVRRIIEELGRLSGREDLLANFRSNALLAAALIREQADRFFVMPYDKLVAGDFAELSDYLGFPVNADYEVGARHDYVARSKDGGDWRKWFLPEDLAYFAHEVADDYRVLGFDPDELPDPEPTIDPKLGSEYLVRQFERWAEKKKAGREKRAGSKVQPANEGAADGAREQRRLRRERRRARAAA